MLEPVSEICDRLSDTSRFEGLHSRLEGLYLEMMKNGALLVKALADEQDATECFNRNPFDVHTAAQWAESRDLVDQLGRNYARAVQDFRDTARRYRGLLA